MVSDGELMHSINSDMEGTGVWDNVKAGFNKYVKPVLSTVGDHLANSLSYSNPSMAPLIQGIRGGVRDLTGVGVSGKKSKKSKKRYDSSSESESEPERKPKRKTKRKIKKGNGLYL